MLITSFSAAGSVGIVAATLSAGGASFTNVTNGCGLGHWIQSADPDVNPVGPPMASGGCVGDFNNDGWQDIFFVSGGHIPDRLYINNGDGTFTDRAEQWGVAHTHSGGGASAGDYDGDGDLDIFVASYGDVVAGIASPQPGMHRLYRNNGDGTFTNVAAEAGVIRTSELVPDGFGSTFGDVDLDGDLDLLVLGWVNNSGGIRLFMNNGDGTFSDETHQRLEDAATLTRGFSPAIVDMNGDGHPEILMACDFGNSKYFVNDGTGRFLNRTTVSGTGLDGNGMGQCVGDFNGDGLLDWYVTSIFTLDQATSQIPGTGNMQYMNLGNHRYREMSFQFGTKDGGWGWGVRAVDVDHDRDIDIVETNGWPMRGAGEDGYAEWDGEQAYLYVNNNNQVFEERALDLGFAHFGQGRGMARLDFDNDGDADILIFSNEGSPTLFRNELDGPDTNWIRVFLESGGAPNIAPNGLGSTVRATVGGVTTIHPMLADCSYLATSEQSVHIGLGTATAIDELLVTWPNGRRTLLENIPVNKHMVIRPTCDGDADGDAEINVDDLVYILFNFGATTADADTNGSGVADFNDLIFTLFRFGVCE